MNTYIVDHPDSSSRGYPFSGVDSCIHKHWPGRRAITNDLSEWQIDGREGLRSNIFNCSKMAFQYFVFSTPMAAFCIV